MPTSTHMKKYNTQNWSNPDRKQTPQLPGVGEWHIEGADCSDQET